MNKNEVLKALFANRIGVLGTMHHKEKVIAPLLDQRLNIKVIVPENFNTDRFGTFTREVERTGNQVEAAKLKAEKALSLTKETLALSSEGTFGPHPFIPFVPYNREIVLLLDKKNDLEIIGESTTTDTNYNQKEINSFQEALEFSLEAGFPAHAVIIKTNERVKSSSEIIKGVTTKEQLHEAVHHLLKKSPDGRLFIETDMRALYNPTRMKNIEAAALDLIEKISSLCPTCSTPGFELADRKKGLLCSACGIPTELTLSHIYKCKKCGTSEEKLYPRGHKFADPGHCPYCNP